MSTPRGKQSCSESTDVAINCWGGGGTDLWNAEKCAFLGSFDEKMPKTRHRHTEELFDKFWVGFGRFLCYAFHFLVGYRHLTVSFVDHFCRIGPDLNPVIFEHGRFQLGQR